jgi:competence protein ComEC
MAIATPKPKPPAGPTYYPLVLIVCALTAGITLDRLYPLAAVAWTLTAVAALCAWLAIWSLRRDRLASALLLASVLAAGGAWHHLYWRLFPADEISRNFDEILRPAVIEAVAVTSPRWVPAPPPTPLRTIPQDQRSEFIVRLTAIRDGRTFRPASGWAELQVGGNLTGVEAGDRLRIMAHAGRPPEPLNPGEFDFAAHLRSERQLCRLFAEFPESVEKLASGGLLAPRRWLANVRSGGTALLRQNIAAERATLASAVLLGAREQLDADRNEGYLVTGTIHVLSISGLHVGILAAGFFVLFRTGLLPRRWTLAATILLTIAYACLTDLAPPVVRATILVVAACLALWCDRTALGFNTLAAAAIAVLVLNPASLFQAGPQLSFLAVATMIVFQPVLMPQPITDPLDRLIARTRPWPIRVGRGMRDIVWRVWLTGALIWLVSTPLVWKQYNLISPIALILNFVMWLPVTIAMYAGLGTLLLGSFAPLAGRLLGMTCDQCLRALEDSIAWGRAIPGAYYWLAAPPGWWIGLFYAVLAALVVFPAMRPRRHWLAAMAALWIAGAALLSGGGSSALPRLWAAAPTTATHLMSASPTMVTYSTRPLACSFVAVGHGVSVLVELPDGRILLYDAGRMGSPLAGVRPVSAVLWSRGISHLDAVVVSHADADHFNALPELLDRFSVGVVYVSPMMFEGLPPAVEELQTAIAQAGVPLREVHAGQRLAVGGGVQIDVLHPPRKGVIGSDNANSIVLSIEYAGRRVLLTGDLESPGLDDLLAEEPLDCDVVLAPHHGSPRSSPSRFAEWSTPETVIISGGQNLGDLAAIATVRRSYRLAGAEVFHTASDGCIRVEISWGEITTRSFRLHVREGAADTGSLPLLRE